MGTSRGWSRDVRENPASAVAFVLGMCVSTCGVAGLAATTAKVDSTVFYGVLLFAAGLCELGAGLHLRHERPFVRLSLAGVLTAVVGLLFLLEPGAARTSLMLLLACYFFASGFFRLITSGAERYPSWGWDVGYGLLAILCGVLIVATWPRSPRWLLGTLVGIELFVRGVVLMAGSAGSRRSLRAV
jgi:uncharacterized membrane protein HdeD (DUF308 family)